MVCFVPSERMVAEMSTRNPRIRDSSIRQGLQCSMVNGDVCVVWIVAEQPQQRRLHSRTSHHELLAEMQVALRRIGEEDAQVVSNMFRRGWQTEEDRGSVLWKGNGAGSAYHATLACLWIPRRSQGSQSSNRKAPSDEHLLPKG